MTKVHMLLIIFLWVAVATIYFMQEKVERCCVTCCKKFRGEDEFLYDSEDDENDSDQTDKSQECGIEDCPKCKKEEEKAA